MFIGVLICFFLFFFSITKIMPFFLTVLALDSLLTSRRELGAGAIRLPDPLKARYAHNLFPGAHITRVIAMPWMHGVRRDRGLSITASRAKTCSFGEMKTAAVATRLAASVRRSRAHTTRVGVGGVHVLRLYTSRRDKLCKLCFCVRSVQT